MRKWMHWLSEEILLPVVLGSRMHHPKDREDDLVMVWTLMSTRDSSWRLTNTSDTMEKWIPAMLWRRNRSPHRLLEEQALLPWQHRLELQLHHYESKLSNPWLPQLQHRLQWQICWILPIFRRLLPEPQLLVHQRVELQTSLALISELFKLQLLPHQLLHRLPPVLMPLVVLHRLLLQHQHLLHLRV